MEFSVQEDLPPAFILFPNLRPPHKTLIFHQIFVLLLTFVAYASFHASRKPPSIVKGVLASSNSTDHPDPGWPPFDGPRGTHRLGELDLVFLASYAVGMYVSGHVGDRIDMRYFLVFGMLGSGIYTVVFGSAYWLGIHQLGFFLVLQIIGGLFQSVGWPCVVAVVGNWFGKSRRGLIMGLWNSHTSFGNIAGSVIASSVLELGWGWSFVLPGVLIISVGVLVYAFLVVEPGRMGLERPGMETEMKAVFGSEKMEEESGLLQRRASGHETGSSAIGFVEAWRLPHVAPFALCLFFSKLVAYTFLYWLPFYIRHAGIAGSRVSNRTAGMLSTIFDVGGVVGGVFAGVLSDVIGGRALTCVLFFVMSVPCLICYRIYGSSSMWMNVVLMLLSGLLVNGPYSLITTAVSADIGTTAGGVHSRVLATVAAIIDGTGSVGAALGPLLAGYVSSTGWNTVFFMLSVSLLLASSFLVRLALHEIQSFRTHW